MEAQDKKRLLETIKARYSVRTYENKPIEKAVLEKLSSFLDANTQGPFGNKVRFRIVDASQAAVSELKKYGSYGLIKGAQVFMAGTVVKGEKDMEDYGYCMEKNVLMATSLGLGTVWLGGMLNRSTFAAKMDASENEVIPAITPIGYPADKRSMLDRFVRTASGGKNRKAFGELFFDGNTFASLDKAVCGKYAEVLEAVRWAPSASNKQPWRIVKEKNTNNYHFYMSEHSTNSMMKDIRIQNNDMGIAMSHFELAARELGLEGSWQVEKPGMEAGKLIYIVSWKG